MSDVFELAGISDPALVAVLVAADPFGLGGVALRARVGPWRERWLTDLRELLPATAPLRRLPLHAGDSRLFGGLDLAATLAAGRPVAERGLLAESDGGLLLLAMAERISGPMAARLGAVLDSGEVILERDGFAARSPARIGMVALDEGIEPDERPPSSLLEHLAFWLDLDGFEPLRTTEQARSAVTRARRLAPGTQVPDAIVEALVGTTLAFGIASLRAPILALRVGGHDPRSIATRLVSAANTDLRTQVEEGTFRLDFLFRINAVTVNLPPLRQRIQDLPILIDYFIDHYARIFHHTPELLSKSAMRLMQSYHWPGNIRQLENLIRSYVLIGSEEALVAELMPEEQRGGITTEIDLSEPVSLKRITKKATQDLERQIILKVLQANSWNRQKTAKWLQISYRSLLYKLSEVGMPEVPSRPLRIPQLVRKEPEVPRGTVLTRSRIS